MKKIIYLFTAAAILLCGCNTDPVKPDDNKNRKYLMELTGSVDGVPTLEKNKAFYLYALLSPAEEWDSFYIDKDNAMLNTDGTVKMSKEYFWPVDENMYRFIGIMNSADQSQPILDMDGPVVGLTAGDNPASDLLLSNNLMRRRTSVDNEMEFRHVMTQVVFEMVVDDDNIEAYSLTGHVANAGKTAAAYSALALPAVDVATVAADAADYGFDLELTAVGTERSPRKVYYLIPDGSDFTSSITGVKLNGSDDVDIPLVTEDGEPITLKSGAGYTVTFHITKGVVSTTVGIGSWVEESLGNQSANAALSEVRWTVTYPEGVGKITKVEIVDNSDKSYFATLDADGKTQSPVDLPATYKELAVWLGNLRVELRPDDYTLVEDALDIKYAFVGTAEQLAAIATDETTLARKYRQAAHIDLGGGEGHTPIGSQAAPFTGVYDGGGYTVIDFKLAAPTANSGLFGYNSGTIKNVTITKTVIEGLLGNSGMICGFNNAGGTIESCVNHADFKSTTSETSTAIGGIAGENRGTIGSCVNFGNGTSSYNRLGGICGNNSGTVESSHNHGNINNSASNSYAGGVAGAHGVGATLNNCTNRGAINGRSYTGGIAGMAYASMTEVTNYGNVTGVGNIGGITGYFNTADITLSRSVNNGRVAGTGGNVGGIVGQSTANVTVSGCTNNGDVAGTGTQIAGIVGNPTGSTSVDHCVNTGNISGPSDTAGIVAGSNQGGSKIVACLNSGSITVTGNHAGGIVSRGAGGGMEITACVNTGNITGVSYLGGIVTYLTQATVAACYSVGTITRTTGTSSYVGGVCAYNSKSVVASYWGGSVASGRGTGTANGHTSDETTKFSATDWPTEATHDGWKLSSNGGYWESLGEYDATNPVYPTLAGLPEVPQP